MKRLVIAAFLVVIMVSGCGKKGDPHAPELTTPEPIHDLTARQDRAGIVLTWSRPTRYAGGGAVTDLASFVIFRKEISPTCRDCPAPYRPLTTVYVEDSERFVKQKQYRYIDDQAQPNAIYHYRVSSQLIDSTLSAPSNEVEIVRGP
jgi:hypothetical protein